MSRTRNKKHAFHFSLPSPLFFTFSLFATLTTLLDWKLNHSLQNSFPFLRVFIPESLESLALDVAMILFLSATLEEDFSLPTRIIMLISNLSLGLVLGTAFLNSIECGLESIIILLVFLMIQKSFEERNVDTRSLFLSILYLATELSREIGSGNITRLLASLISSLASFSLTFLSRQERRVRKEARKNPTKLQSIHEVNDLNLLEK